MRLSIMKIMVLILKHKCGKRIVALSLLSFSFEEAHHRNIQAKFYNEKFPLVYESDNI